MRWTGDKRWDRNKLAWDAIVLGRGEQCTCSPSEYVEQCYAKGETDEFLKPAFLPTATNSACAIMTWCFSSTSVRTAPAR